MTRTVFAAFAAALVMALPLDFAWAFVEQGIGGVAVGLIHGRTR